MPYSVGAQGTHGCSGYPVIKTKTGEVMGCHPTQEDANKQLAALHINEPEAKADSSILPAQPSSTTDSLYPGVGIKRPKQGRAGGTTGSNINSSYAKKPKIRGRGRSGDALDSNGAIASGGSGGSMGTKSDDINDMIKEQGPCWDGYAQRGMKPGDNGKMVPNCVPVKKINDLWEDTDDVIYESKSLTKAEGYSPPAGARAAARRAIKFKEDGKANGAGTAVGWTRAGQLARGETLSLSTVKRMYSYFSRHEVDKKGKDWGNTANPSNGYIMWLAWGGDAGFSWSRGIVEREKNNKLWSGSAFAKQGCTPTSPKCLDIMCKVCQTKKMEIN